MTMIIKITTIRTGKKVLIVIVTIVPLLITKIDKEI